MRGGGVACAEPGSGAWATADRGNSTHSSGSVTRCVGRIGSGSLLAAALAGGPVFVDVEVLHLLHEVRGADERVELRACLPRQPGVHLREAIGERGDDGGVEPQLVRIALVQLVRARV